MISCRCPFRPVSVFESFSRPFERQTFFRQRICVPTSPERTRLRCQPPEKWLRDRVSETFSTFLSTKREMREATDFERISNEISSPHFLDLGRLTISTENWITTDRNKFFESHELNLENSSSISIPRESERSGGQRNHGKSGQTDDEDVGRNWRNRMTSTLKNRGADEHSPCDRARRHRRQTDHPLSLSGDE